MSTEVKIVWIILGSFMVYIIADSWDRPKEFAASAPQYTVQCVIKLKDATGQKHEMRAPCEIVIEPAQAPKLSFKTKGV